MVRRLLPQGWLAHVDHIPRCMLKSEEKVTRAPTSQQSAGQRDVASGEVIRNNDVGGAGVCMVVISLSRLCQTPPTNLAVRGRGYGFIRRCIISPNAVVNSSTSHNIVQGLQSAGNLLVLPAIVAPGLFPSTTPRPSIPTHGHTAHLASSNSVEVPS